MTPSKRTSLYLAAICLTLSASVPLFAEESTPEVPGDDWPRFLGPGGNNKSRETGVITEWGENGPRLAWAVAAGEGYTGPTVADGRLFLFDRHGSSARLRTLDSRTGEEFWRSEYTMEYEDYYEYSNGPRASPLVDGDRVYTFGVEGRLRCLRVTDGSLLWDIDTTATFGVVKNFFGVGSTPIIEGDLLIVPIGGSPPGTPKIHSGKVVGNGSGIVAFDKLTGDVRYRSSDELASYASPIIATIGGRRRAFAFMRGGLLAFDPTTGAVDFHYPWQSKTLESVNASTPVIVGDTVFISETYGPGSSLLRINSNGYDVVWADGRRDQSLATHWATPIHHEEHLYASSGRNTGDTELRAVEHLTGEVAWSQAGLTRSTLLFADGYLVALGEYGVLRLIRATPDAYEPIAQVDLGKMTTPLPGPRGKVIETPLLSFPAWNAPVLSHGLLYLRGKDTLIALELIPPA
jgi:outer membrane protein assembly factor BamB